MKELETHQFVEVQRAHVEFPEAIWSGKILELDMADVSAKNTDDLSARRVALLNLAKKKGYDLKVNRGKDKDGKPTNTLIVQATKLASVTELAATETETSKAAPTAGPGVGAKKATKK